MIDKSASESLNAIDMSALGALSSEVTPEAPAADATTVFLYNMDRLEAAKSLLSNDESQPAVSPWGNIGRNSLNTVKNRLSP